MYFFRCIYTIIPTKISSIDFEMTLQMTFGLARSETSTRCRPGNGLLGLANIWSRLMKHNWWGLLYERIRIHTDVFFLFYIQRKFISVRLYQLYVVRISAHACVCSAIMIFISSLWIVFFFWTAENKSYRNHQIKLIIIDFSKV